MAARARASAQGRGALTADVSLDEGLLACALCTTTVEAVGCCKDADEDAEESSGAGMGAGLRCAASCVAALLSRRACWRLSSRRERRMPMLAMNMVTTSSVIASTNAELRSSVMKGSSGTVLRIVSRPG